MVECWSHVQHTVLDHWPQIMTEQKLKLSEVAVFSTNLPFNNVKYLKLNNFLPPLDSAHLLTVGNGYHHLKCVQISAPNSKYRKSYGAPKFVCFSLSGTVKPWEP